MSPLRMRLGPAVLALSCLAAAGCGESGTSLDPVPITGGERLGWDQQAGSAADLNSYVFTLYVDGAPRTLRDVQCDATPGAAGFACSAPLPPLSDGVHELRLSASSGGVESDPSPPLLVRVGSSSLAVAGSPPPQPVDPPSELEVCTGGSGTECYRLETLASGLEPVTALAAAADGSVLFVEGGTRIRLVRDGAIQEAPALQVDAAAARIAGLAIAPDFTQSRRVLVATSADRGSGAWELSITRFRELAGVLGEGAPLVSGLLVPADRRVPLATDAHGLLYAAMPGLADARARPGDTAYTRALLRFTADGYLPAQNAAPTPVIGDGYEHPTALAIGYDGRIWLTGRDRRWRHVLSTMAPDGAPRAGFRTPEALIAAPPNGTGDPEVLVAIGSSPASPVLLAYRGALYIRTVRSDGREVSPPDEWTPFPMEGAPTAVAVGPENELLVALRDRSGGSRLVRFNLRGPMTMTR